MKVGIVTFHFSNNFGGVLQAYALQKTIENECSAEAVILDYRHWFIRFAEGIRVLPITTNIAEIISGLKTIHLRLKRLKMFQKFIQQNDELMPYPGGFRSNKEQQPDCEKYVCGSDQIWNPIITFGVSDTYFLGFVKERARKFSYAVSFGISNISPGSARKMKPYLSEFRSISVRESEGRQIVKQIANLEAVQHIDPTFLISKEEWSTVANKPQITEPYILLYIMQRNKEVYDFAKRIKERLGIKIVEISRYGYKPDFVDITLVDVGPAEFLGLFQQAAYVCTNSFHGFAFSLIFEKEFCLIPSRHFGSRMSSLTELMHIKLPNELNGDKDDSAVYDKAVVRDIISLERERAVAYLNKNIWEG